MTFQQISNTWWYRLLKVIWIFLLLTIGLGVSVTTYAILEEGQMVSNNIIGWTLFSGAIVQLIFIGIRQAFLYIVIGNQKTEE